MATHQDSPRPLMLVDSASLYFRAFHGVPTSVTAPDGRPVNAIRGFLDMISTLITRRSPDRFVACLDLDWRPAFRVELVPTYKAHRVDPGGGESVPDELEPQVPILLDVLAAVGLSTAGAAGFEADDVIGTLAHRARGPVEVVSGDRDLFGVVTDFVRLLYVGRGVAKLEDCGPDEVSSRYGIPAERYADFAVLRGDPSDGLPGVKGVGEKTAAALVARFGGVEDVLAAARDGADGFPAGARAKVVDAEDYLQRAPGVVRVRTDARIEGGDGRLPKRPADAEALIELADRHNLDGPVSRLLTALSMDVELSAG